MPGGQEAAAGVELVGDGAGLEVGDAVQDGELLAGEGAGCFGGSGHGLVGEGAAAGLFCWVEQGASGSPCQCPLRSWKA